MTRTDVPSRQRGAALVVSLLLLVVLTILGVVGMSGATLELAMAGNMQFQSAAFEAADSIVEAEIRRPDINPLANPGVLPQVGANTNRPFTDRDGDLVATATATTSYERRSGLTGWQLGGNNAFAAYHFEIGGQAQAARGARADHTQGYYVVGPSF